jgi:hypothetical protein
VGPEFIFESPGSSESALSRPNSYATALDLFFILSSLTGVQDMGVWPQATISECAWHAEKAIKEYFAKHNQLPLARDHAPLNYKDSNIARGWTNELDTGWIEHRNKILEESVRIKVVMPRPPS